MKNNPIDNPNFVEWFGDSKVIDEIGNPLVDNLEKDSEYQNMTIRMLLL